MSEIDSLLKRVVQLDELISHHEHHVQQLNYVIVEVRDELVALQIKCANQPRRLETLSDSQARGEGEALADQTPPHYSHNLATYLPVNRNMALGDGHSNDSSFPVTGCSTLKPQAWSAIRFLFHSSCRDAPPP